MEILVTRYQRKAVQTAYLITHDEQLAEDVAQETFVRLYQHIERYNEARPCAPYLLRSMANAALNTIEKTARWVQYGGRSRDGQMAAQRCPRLAARPVPPGDEDIFFYALFE